MPEFQLQLVAVTLFTMFTQDQATVLQHLHREGGFENVIVTPYEPLRLANLVARADLIVEASAVGSRSFFADDGLDVHTDVTFHVRSILKNMTAPDLTTGATITVRRTSGTMIVDGRTAITVENDFLPFEDGPRYLLLLSRSIDGRFFSVVGDGQGAFNLTADPTSLSTLSPSTAMSVAAFVDEVRALVKFSSY